MPASTSLLAQIADGCQADGLSVENGEKIAAVIGAEFNVPLDGVAILRVEAESLVFVHPTRLHSVGRIPFNNFSSVAVRTLNTKRPEIMNNFTKTKHTTTFEMADVSGQPAGPELEKGHQTIQKLMSVPVISGGRVVGVIQVSRKGPSLIGAGPDFVSADLQKLEGMAATLARCFG